jgi:hypothetical protein
VVISATAKVKVVAYRLVGGLWGDGLCYIIIEDEGEVVLAGIQHAADNVSHGSNTGSELSGLEKEKDMDECLATQAVSSRMVNQANQAKKNQADQEENRDAARSREKEYLVSRTIGG